MLVCVRHEPNIWKEIYGAAFSQLWSERSMLMHRRLEVQAVRHASLGRYIRAFCPLPRKLIMLLRHGVPTLRH